MSLESSAVSMDAGSPAPQVGSVPQGDSVMAGSRLQAVGCPFRSEVKPQQSRVEHLAQIEQERRIEVAQAKAVLMARKYIDAAQVKLGRGPNFALYDVEDHAWAIVAEEPDPSVLAVEREEALDSLWNDDEENGGIGMGSAPRASAIRASYALAVSLGEVLAVLQRKDPRDADDIVRDLRARLESDGETIEGAWHARWCAVARYRRAKAARLAAEASDPSAARNARPGGLRERPHEGG